MTEESSPAVVDNHDCGEIDADLSSQRAQLVRDLAWLVVRYHRRCGVTHTDEHTRVRNRTEQRRNPNR